MCRVFAELVLVCIRMCAREHMLVGIAQSRLFCVFVSVCPEWGPKVVGGD